jgi:DNA-binding PadR family transcriptional regulator
MAGDVKLTKREREYLNAVMDWSAPYEIAERLFGYSNGNLVTPKLGVMIGKGVVTWSRANNTYRITDAGRAALDHKP